MKFEAKVISNKNTWGSCTVGVFQDGKQIGSYERNYSLLKTFEPFRQDNKWYALYSPNYTATRVMELPSCKDLGGEEPASHGFCPVEYWVPTHDYDEDEISKAGYFGLIAGFVWGDDSSWKLQWLDLSEASKGIVRREERFGYVPLFGSLRESVRIKDYRKYDDDLVIYVAQEQSFNIKGDKFSTFDYFNGKHIRTWPDEN